MWALPKGWSPSEVECPSVGPSRNPAPEDSSFLQSSKGCRVDIYSTMVLHALQGENMLHKSPPQHLQHLLAFLPLALISAELFLPPLSHTLSQAHSEVPPVWMTDSAWAGQCQPWSHLKWALSNKEQLPVSSPRSHPCISLLQNLATNSTQTCTPSIRAHFDLDSSSASPLDNNSPLPSFSFTLCGFPSFFLFFDRLRYFISSFYLINNEY